MPVFGYDQLRRVSIAILEAAGVPSEEAEIVGEISACSNLHGVDGQGVSCIPELVKWVQGDIQPGDWLQIPFNPDAKIKVVKETPNFALWDANGGFGHVAGKKAMEMAVKKAERNGVFGTVGFFNSSWTGPNFYYGMIALEHGMIGIVTSKGVSDMAAWGGARGVIGNNPVCVAIPAGKEKPIILDMATSVLSVGALQMMVRRGEKIPEGCLLDEKGRPTTDFQAYRRGGAKIPFGTYKGYGIAVIIEALTGGLTGFGCSFDSEGFAILMTAINISGFTPIHKFKSIIDGLIKHLKASPTRPGIKEVRVPGESKFREKEKRSKEGIYIDDITWQELQETAKKLGLEPSALI